MGNWFKDIIPTKDQYEVAKAQATIAWLTIQAMAVVRNLPEIFSYRHRRWEQ